MNEDKVKNLDTLPHAETRPLGFRHLIGMAPKPLGWAMATAIGSAALSVAPLWFIYLIAVQLLSPSADEALIRTYAGCAVILLAARWALMAVSHVLSHIGAFSVQHRLRLAMAQRLGEVPLSFFSQRGTGGLRRTLGDDVSSMEGFLAHMLADAVAAAAVPVVSLGLLFLADWRLALAALLPLPMAVALQVLLMRKSAGRMREWSQLQTRIANQVGEYLRGVHVVRSFGLDAQSFGELAQSVRHASAWVAGYARSSSLGWVVFSCLLSTNLVVVAPWGAWLHANGTLDSATYVLFLLAAPMVLLPLLRLTFTVGEQMQRAQALARIGSVLTAPALIESGAAIPAGKSKTALAIDFIDIRHRYGDRVALDGVTFRAEAGQLTAVVGASGSGKSTLIRLVARLCEIEAGSVRLGERDLREWPLDSLLSRMGIVFQEVMLFHGTVYENLRMADPDASHSAIEAAAMAAQADGFIRALPNGYHSVISERGAQLSGGERQRLSIARALLKNAPILLLDEATASVDSENEALIQEALARLCRGRTVLMVAHRLRTVMNAHRIVVLDKGRIVGEGKHASLLTTCPIYQKLWRDHEQARDWTLRSRPLAERTGL